MDQSAANRFALAELIQWVYRSRVRRGLPIPLPPFEEDEELAGEARALHLIQHQLGAIRHGRLTCTLDQRAKPVAIGMQCQPCPLTPPLR